MYSHRTSPLPLLSKRVDLQTWLSRSGEPRYRCRDCQRSFQLYYHNVGNRDGITEKIVEMAINGSGVRDTNRVLGVSITTVIPHLKKIKARHS